MESLNFKKVFRGYDPEEVNKDIAEIRHNLAEAEANNRELLLKINGLSEVNAKYENRFKSYQETEKDISGVMLMVEEQQAQVSLIRLHESISELMAEKKRLESQIEKAYTQLEMRRDSESQSDQRIVKIKKKGQQTQVSVTCLIENISELIHNVPFVKTMIFSFIVNLIFPIDIY